MGGYCNPAYSFTKCPAGTMGTVTAGISEDHACEICTEGYGCPKGSTALTKEKVFLLIIYLMFVSTP